MNEIINDQLNETYLEFINEEILAMHKYQNETIEMYKNPTHSELKNIMEWSRGIIDENGNLYFASSDDKYSNIQHSEIADYLGLNYNKIVLLFRKSKTNTVVISENTMIDYDEYMELSSRLIKKCKFNNPLINFEETVGVL